MTNRKNNVSPLRRSVKAADTTMRRSRVPALVIFTSLSILGLIVDTLIPTLLVQLDLNIMLFGAGLVACGIALLIVSVGLFGALRREDSEHAVSWYLIARGPYRYSRNPIYLAMTIMMAGIGLYAGSAIVLLLLPVAILLVDIFVIRPEERDFAQQLGKPYTDYQRSVRRWL